MKPFAELVNELEAAFGGGSKAGLDYLYGRRPWDWAEIEIPPDDDQLRRFLDVLRGGLAAENKNRSAQRLAALDKLIRFTLHHRTYVGEYATRDREFIFQLALRIREPKTITQDDTGSCGPTALVIHLAKHHPEDYMRIALKLFKHGTAQWGQLTLSAPKTAYRRKLDGRMPFCDMVVIGAVGKAMVTDLSMKMKSKIEGSPGKEVKKVLQRIGYNHVEDHTHTWIGLNRQNLAHVQRCAAAVGNGHVVVLCYKSGASGMTFGMFADALTEARDLPEGQEKQSAHRKLHKTDQDKNLDRSRKIDRTSNHWALVDKLTVNGNNVSFKLFTYGSAVGATVPLKAFLDYYGGYVKAEHA